jgi:tetratricopeptide (TPR) repeat protein/transcriptional regulator with XRE-family HTH domain
MEVCVSDDRSALGRNLRTSRLAAGLSQQQLAELSGLSVRAIGDIERGRARWPYPDSLRRLADALGIRDQARTEFFAAGQRSDAAASATAVADLAGPGSRPPRADAVEPRQLPAPLRHFAGRSGELAVLAGLLSQAGPDTRPAVVISAIGGLAGIGKTALAVQFAHQEAGSFPDGQLYVNLRGYDPALPPMPAAEAVRLVLDAFQIPAGQIPASAEAQAGLYRSVLAGKKVLIVLDNAADAAQVRPLLPGSPGCLVIVTSRGQLAGLVATDGAIPMKLDVLPTAEARGLLARILGDTRVAAEPDAARQVIELCGRLPLALAITAARAATNPRLPLAELATELAHAAGRLDALDTGEPAASVRAALDSSYQHLTADAARMFRLLGLQPGPDISAPAATSLAGLPGPQAARHLTELAGASLITRDAAGRYALHDLVRLYAAEQAHRARHDAEQDAATSRMLGHYMHTGFAAARLLSPGRDPIAVDPPAPGTTPEHLTGYQAAMSWFEAEHRVLVTAAGHAYTAGRDVCAWNIAWTLLDYLSYQGHWHDQLAVSTTALAAAARLGDPALQAKSHYYCARAAVEVGRYSDAQTSYQHALELSRQLTDPIGQGLAHIGLAFMLDRQQQPAPAADHARQALDLYIAAGHLPGQANALNHIGWYLSQLGDYEQALVHCQQALALCRKAGRRHTEGTILDSLGYAHHHLGQHIEAITCYRQALDIFQETGQRYQQANTLSHIGDTYQTAREYDAAHTAWREALTILDDLQHPDADQVRTKLETSATTLAAHGQRGS